MPVDSASPATIKFPRSNTVRVVGMTCCEGQDLEGVELGPKALRDGGLHAVIKSLGWSVQDDGDVTVDPAKTPTADAEAEDTGTEPKREVKKEVYTEEEVPHAKIIGEACRRGFEIVSESAQKDSFVLSIGGDHSIATATIAGMMKKHPDLCVVWVDAHGDINTPESSPSRHYHGMPVAHLMNLFAKETPGFRWLTSVPALEPNRLAFIGLRDIDELERDIIATSGVHPYSMKEVDALGIGEIMRKVLADVDPAGRRPIHLSFDIDACDPAIAPGTGTRARGGLSYREAHYICETLHDTGRLVSMDLVEVNPKLDAQDEFLHGDNPLIPKGATKTVRLGVELISSALGKHIL